MGFQRYRSAWTTVLAGLALLFSLNVAAQHEEGQQHGENQGHGTEEAGINPGLILMEHILDNHEFHFADYKGHAISIPLPIIVYQPGKGVSAFMSSRFEHGHADHNGYRITKDHETGKESIVAVGADGQVDPAAKVYDFSMTRNVVQMLLSLLLLVWIMIKVANRYAKYGPNKAPTGIQNAVEPVITFIRDDVAKPNLGRYYTKFMPYLLTIFFFILINNLTGLIPGAANVTGNIAVTLLLGLISLVVILFNTNKHFWGHIFNPPVPGFVKPILTIVEFLGVFIKPVALIIRLFANMVAGHMIIACLILMIFIFAQLAPAAGLAFSPVSILFTVFIYAIELLVAFIQAYIFTNLTAVFIGLSMEGEQFREEGAPAHHH
ncbi:MAG TPA: F0F1 ATP synthase subunit A [Phnomibacter sp.]|nr:F0F1 ATP synthase subunit A [Phnomibacter sp.]